MPNYSDWLAQCICEIFCSRSVGYREWDCIALDLGRPSRHVAEQIDCERYVGRLRDVERLAVVEAFDVTEFFGMLLEEIGELPDEASALGRSHPAPRPVIERFASSLYGLIYVFAIAFRNLRQNLSCGRIVSRKSFSGSGIDPPAVDQHFSWLVDELRDLRMNLRGNCDAHTSSLIG